MPAPLSPEQLAEASKRLDKLTQSLEDTILEDICRRIAKTGAVTDTAEYQLMRLKEMGYANSFIEKAIADYMQKSEAEIRQLFFEAAQVSSDFYEKYYMQNGKAAVPLEDNEYMQQLISAGIEQTKGELNNFTQSMGFAVKQPDGSLKFQPVAKAYQSCLDLAHSQVATGVFDYNTAIRNATAALTGKGLQFVDYASGHRNRADVAVRRAVLTGIGQMAARVAEKAMDDLGTEYVEVTAHAGARPDHAKWQGRIYHWDRKNNGAVNIEKVLDNGGGSGIIRSSGHNNQVNGHHYFEKIADIDFSNAESINESLNEFEKQYLHSDIEHCRVITPLGEVFDVHGDKFTVDTSLLGDKLIGSINEHNHVIGESQYSFSFEDLISSARDGSYKSSAFDEKFRYEMTFTHNVTEDDAYSAYEKAEENVMNRRIFGEKIDDVDCQHEIIAEACRLLNILYMRVKR